jgi:hypothetical protein
LCHLCSRTDDTKKKKKNDAWIDIYIFWHIFIVKKGGVQGMSDPPLWDTGYLNFQNPKKISSILKNE